MPKGNKEAQQYVNNWAHSRKGYGKELTHNVRKMSDKKLIRKELKELKR